MKILNTFTAKRIFFSLVIFTLLALAAGGGYLLGIEKGKAGVPQFRPIETITYQEGLLKYVFSDDGRVDKVKDVLAAGTVKEVNGEKRSLLLQGDSQQMLIHISQDARFYTADAEERPLIQSLEGDQFSEIKAGDWIDVSGLKTTDEGLLVGTQVVIAH